MILTIGMIVRNEEKYLERCLTAIKPILDRVDCELIITDTGSTDRTVEIASKFTDNVLHFDWVKDFSAARNHGLEKAKGEWFMFLDADNIFLSCDGIIDFFNSGEYRKYNSASYVTRDYFLTGELMQYKEGREVRLTKLTPSTRFIGRIHESLNTIGPPIKDIPDINEHFGYVYETEEALHNKFERNTELLLQEFETQKDKSPLLHFQLFEAYAGIGDNEKALQYADSGIALSRRMKNIMLITFHAGKANLFHSIGEYEKAIAVCNDYFLIDRSVRPHTMTSDGTILAVKALSLAELGRNDEAVPVFVKFFDVFKGIQSGKISTQDAYLKQYRISSEQNILAVLCDFVRCCILSGKYATAEEYITKFPISRYPDVDRAESVLAQLAVQVFAANGLKDVKPYYSQFGEDCKMWFRNSLCGLLFFDSRKAEVIAALDVVSTDDEMLAEKLGTYSAHFLDGSLSADDVYAFAKKYGTGRNHDLFMLLMSHGYDISPLFDDKEYRPLVCAGLCCDYVFGFYDAAEKYDAVGIIPPDKLPAAAEFYEVCARFAANNKKDPTAQMRIFIDIARHCESSSAQQTPAVKAALALGNAEEYRAAGNYRECFAEMKNAVEAYPAAASTVSAYRDIVTAEYEKTKKSAVSPEMQQLAQMLKNNVRALIGKGDIASARKILAEYEKIAPSDPEIAELKNETGAAEQ